MLITVQLFFFAGRDGNWFKVQLRQLLYRLLIAGEHITDWWNMH
jgi:hypothetical protein